MPRLIAFIGYQRSGKTTCAKILEDKFYFQRTRFAGKVREMLEPLLPYREISYWLEGDGKNKPCPHLGGKTPVFAMQRLGTEWGRNSIDPDLWVDQWARDAAELLYNDDVVVDDARFPNEIEKIRKLGGEIWRVTRPGFDRASDHESEAYVDSIVYDKLIANTGSIDDLINALDKALGN